MPVINFFKDIFEKRDVIYRLTKQDFKTRFAGSVLGLLWAFIQPLAMMLILWLVFSVGLKMGLTRNIPFPAWFFTAMILWNFVSDFILTATNVFGEYSFLVKKINFKISILPVVKLLSSLVLHGVFVIILVGILIFYGYYPNLYWFQAFYYLFGAIILSLGMAWMMASANVFMKDISQVVGIIIQFGFWMTPIVWPASIVPEKYHIYLKLNPVYYLVEGYRQSFLFKIPFWEVSLWQTIYFWGLSFFFLFFGIFIFRRLRPHFADVL